MESGQREWRAARAPDRADGATHLAHRVKARGPARRVDNNSLQAAGAAAAAARLGVVRLEQHAQFGHLALRRQAASAALVNELVLRRGGERKKVWISVRAAHKRVRAGARGAVDGACSKDAGTRAAQLTLPIES